VPDLRSAGNEGLLEGQPDSSRLSPPIEDETPLDRPALAPPLCESLQLHFLCNTLHLLQGIVHTDPDRVERMLDELCDLLHHLLLSSRVADVALRDEVAALRAYASLQTLRFQDRLEIELEVDPAAINHRVPGFLLYPLLENAVKYGLETASWPVRVRASVRASEDVVTLEVANTGRWIRRSGPAAPNQGNGLALASTRRRLTDLFPGRHRFVVSEEGGWVRVRVEIPARGASPA
jgi:two-component system LytT family sensor kinase